MCTGIYVGRKASKNGHTYIGKSADSSASKDKLAGIKISPRQTGCAGKYHQSIESKLRFKLPNVCNRYMGIESCAVADGRGKMEVALSNDYGLCVTGTVSTHLHPKIAKIDPNTNNGICEQTICKLIIMTCKTCKESIDLIEKLMEKNGNLDPNTVLVADQKEAWIIELYSGHQWAAIKCPEDKVSVFGNVAMIQTEYVGLSEDAFRHSKDLFELPKRAKTAAYDKKGNMIINLSYLGQYFYHDYSMLRTYFGHKLLSPSTAGKYNVKKLLPLFFTPDKKVSNQDIFNVYRCRFEGSKYSPDETGREDMRVIATEATYSVHVFEVDPKAESKIATILWATLGCAENSVFLPFNNLISKVEPKYSAIDDNYRYFGTKNLPKDRNGRDIHYSENIAHIYFKRLNSLVAENRALYKDGVYGHWAKFEKQMLSEYTKIYKQASLLFAKDKLAAKKLITNYCIKVQKEALSDADVLFKELLWYIMTNVETLKYSVDYKNKRLVENKPLPFVPTFGLKNKKFI